MEINSSILCQFVNELTKKCEGLDWDLRLEAKSGGIEVSISHCTYRLAQRFFLHSAELSANYLVDPVTRAQKFCEAFERVTSPLIEAMRKDGTYGLSFTACATVLKEE